MSNLTHCDGPGCDETEDKFSQRLCDGPWIRVDQGQGASKLDFHDRQCLANWAGQSSTSTTEVTGR